jgi:hypothetical protein
MFLFGVGLPDTHSQNHLSVQFCMGEIGFSGGIHHIHQFHIEIIAGFVSEADHVKQRIN